MTDGAVVSLILMNDYVVERLIVMTDSALEPIILTQILLFYSGAFSKGDNG